MLSLKSYAPEVERIRRRALARRAQAQGVVFSDGDDAKKSFTDYTINDAQADVPACGDLAGDVRDQAGQAFFLQGFRAQWKSAALAALRGIADLSYAGKKLSPLERLVDPVVVRQLGTQV